jgi:hypothetical protein
MCNMNKNVKQSTYSRLEDVDKSCAHAVLITGLIFAVLAYLIYPGGISDIPFSELTAGPVIRLTVAVVLGVLSILIFIDVLNVFIKR